ncbi:hypothetical protein B0H11DRAFT_1942950 [Mycena galericulata]|nr:hypothetical protein B0H11DRAFT_1942950 [Mycena galericulata]
MLRLLFGFWGIEVAAWQLATSVWVLGDQGCNLASCDFCLGSGGSRSQAGKLRPWFGFWGIRLSCGLASRNLFLASRQRLPLMVGRTTWPVVLPLSAVITGNNLPNCLPDIGAIIGNSFSDRFQCARGMLCRMKYKAVKDMKYFIQHNGPRHRVVQSLFTWADVGGRRPTLVDKVCRHHVGKSVPTSADGLSTSVDLASAKPAYIDPHIKTSPLYLKAARRPTKITKIGS